jgi:hypothetical protein
VGEVDKEGVGKDLEKAPCLRNAFMVFETPHSVFSCVDGAPEDEKEGEDR